MDITRPRAAGAVLLPLVLALGVAGCSGSTSDGAAGPASTSPPGSPTSGAPTAAPAAEATFTFEPRGVRCSVSPGTRQVLTYGTVRVHAPGPVTLRGVNLTNGTLPDPTTAWVSRPREKGSAGGSITGTKPARRDQRAQGWDRRAVLAGAVLQPHVSYRIWFQTEQRASDHYTQVAVGYVGTDHVAGVAVWAEKLVAGIIGDRSSCALS